MEFEFGYNDKATREFMPQYGDIDWHQIWLQKNDNKDNWSIWGETIDEHGEFCEQLNQTNCAFYLNESNTDFDVLVVNDHRDSNADFWWCRYQLGDKEFDKLLEKIGDEVAVVFTKYPMEAVVKFVLGIMESDINES